MGSNKQPRLELVPEEPAEECDDVSVMQNLSYVKELYDKSFRGPPGGRNKISTKCK